MKLLKRVVCGPGCRISSHLAMLLQLRSETMERLMRLVVAQGETIQAQLRRLQEREHQIEQYEQQMHLLRVQNLGTDYLLHSYLKDDPAEAKDDPGSEEKSNDSGVVTEEASDAALTSALESNDVMEGAGDAITEEILAIMDKIEEVNTRLLHEEEALAGMTTAVTAAQEQQKDETQLLQQELACVARIHAQLVTDARNNEQTLRDTEVVLWQQRKQLDLLLQEDSESDLETRALRQHLDYIIHLPPSAFMPSDLPPQSVPAPTVASSRVSPLTSCPGDHATAIPSTRLPTNTVQVKEEDTPPPLPSCPPPIPTCPPPILEEDEDDGDSARTESLCVSSRSSTSSEASTGSSGISTTAPSTSLTKPSPSSSATNPSSTSTSKQGDSGGKDTDSTDSNSDTGLSSLHSSSDEGVYVLDTLV
ncbi:hypothetical protein Pcinc_007146 [Petrolisthes cinctipes]|uniref:Uncharacterized protein n=1 Tax=Petrolisthes cinctipes TaxID=88211 RepID=A0AAE1G9W4_PETCI|nr:hypothetical protein Pcinc_007146 [Petrolisthes cinctipes]